MNVDSITKFAALFLLVVTGQVSAAASISDQWIQRGRLGESRVREIAQSAKGKPNEGETMQMKIEAGFALNARPAGQNKETDTQGELQVFHLVILGATEKEGCVIGFVYKREQFATFRIESLPTEWSVLVAATKNTDLEKLIRQRYREVYGDTKTNPNPIVIDTNGQSIIFDLAAPMRPFALDYEIDRIRKREQKKQ